MAGVITVSAVVLLDDDDRIVTVRKRGTTRFMLPGGKPDAGEGPADTALRECREELGVSLDPASLHPLGHFTSDTANEPGMRLESDVFLHPHVDGVAAAAEIDEIRLVDLWEDPPAADLAPMLAFHVIPVLRKRSQRSVDFAPAHSTL